MGWPLPNILGGKLCKLVLLCVSAGNFLIQTAGVHVMQQQLNQSLDFGLVLAGD